MQELARFTDPMGDAKAHVFVCTHAQQVGHFGRALKCALAHLDSKPGVVDMEHRYAMRATILFYIQGVPGSCSFVFLSVIFSLL